MDTEEDGIFLFKNSKAKVVELTANVVETVLVVTPEQLQQESRTLFVTEAEATALTAEQQKLRLQRRKTKANRRHKKRTRRIRLIRRIKQQ